MAVNITPRWMDGAVRTALADTPCVLVVGPRQSGKTTLCRAIAQSQGLRYLTLDEGTTLAAATLDPEGFLGGFEGPLVLDEVQRAPALLRALKLSVDRDRQPGRYLLTGSANVLTLPRVSESLAGRMEVLTLWTFSAGELAGLREGFVDAAFAGAPLALRGQPEPRPALLTRALRGGYPEVCLRADPARQAAWFGSYLTSLVQLDLRELAQLENLVLVPRLLALLASRAGQVLNVADLARALGLPHTTLTRYLALLECLMLVQPVPAWSASGKARLLKAPRLLLTDSGLLAHLAGLDGPRLQRDPNAAGPLLENFVAMELLRQLGSSATRAKLHHFRSYSGQEVDLVLESADHRVVGIEVKAGQVGEGDFKGLRALADLAGERFVAGYILHGGEALVPFGRNLWAAPISALWQAVGSPGRGRTS